MEIFYLLLRAPNIDLKLKDSKGEIPILAAERLRDVNKLSLRVKSNSNSDSEFLTYVMTEIIKKEPEQKEFLRQKLNNP